jgi:hypothetical protein
MHIFKVKNGEHIFFRLDKIALGQSSLPTTLYHLNVMQYIV